MIILKKNIQKLYILYSIFFFNLYLYIFATIYIILKLYKTSMLIFIK